MKGNWRVKVYHLENDGTWKEIGTGNVFCNWSQNFGSHLKVESEADSSVLLVSQISHEEIYDRQNENIILWNEVTSYGDLGIALSFQDTMGCSYVWKVIQDFKKNFSDTNCTNLLDDNLHDSMENNQNGIKIIGQLPEPECNIQNLIEIRDRLTTVNPVSKESFANFLLLDSARYIHDLVKLSCDNELTDPSIMPIISDIWKSIFYLNDINVVEVLIKDDIFINIAGSLEYDKALASKGNYRNFLTSWCKHRQVAKYMNPEICQLSIKLYQLKYLKDYMLRPAIDESGVGALNSVIMSTTLSICTLVFNDMTYMEAILYVLSGNQYTVEEIRNSSSSSSNNIDTFDDLPSQSRIDSLRFMRELFQLSRQLQFDKRVDLYKSLLETLKDKLFSGLCQVLNDLNSLSDERICASEILVSIVIISPSVLRKYIRQGPSP